MDSILKCWFRHAISRLRENNFQDFVNALLIGVYGTTYTSVKNKRDKGCDGIIDNRIVVADYAPETIQLRDFKKKVKEDYEKYKKHWKKYPEWELFYNGEFTADRLQFIETLDKKIIKTDINQILELIETLSWPKKRELALFLHIDEELFINDILQNVVDDLLKDRPVKSTQNKRIMTPPLVKEKIELNYDVSEVQAAIAEYETMIPSRNRLKNILIAYSDDEISCLKLKIVEQFNKLNGSFKQKTDNLVEIISERNRNDDLYKFYVKVVIIYLFEICTIGQRPIIS